MLLTTSQAAAELGIAVTTFRRLVHAGLLPGLSKRGVRVMIPLETVQALSERPPAPLDAISANRFAVLRMDTARPTDLESDWMGFSADLTPDELLKTLRGWWRCDAAGVAAGGVLPVTVAGFVVAVLTSLNTWVSNDHGRHAFPDATLAGHVTDLATPAIHLTATTAKNRTLAKRLLGTRLPSRSGGPIAYISTPELTEGP
ncbi:helix-turn-helix domain-containing protein [Streptomyces sp. NPDC006551]|uniref:helix-turn-helix domain-containing protein n=1 Tax=Streptomyces sp. NPDC006551 TaxID=3157178 RepID=UPI0033B58F53